MIGFYDYTVWLTYISLMVSMVGISLSFSGNVGGGILCLAISGFLDGFDGKVARTKKNRTEEQKKFGIQIDSLSDIVCFGIGPAAAAYASGMDKWYGIAILLLYGTTGMIRLGYFNVMEEARQKETTENRKYYTGLPITSASIFLPMLYWLLQIFPFLPARLCWHVAMLVIGALFVLKIKVKKPTGRYLAVIIAVVSAVFILGLVFGR